MTELEKQELTRARERANLARLRFANAFDGLLERVGPERLSADALDAAADRFESARRHLLQRLRHWPYLLVGALLAGLLAYFWRPALAASRHGLRIAGLFVAARNIWRQWT